MRVEDGGRERGGAANQRHEGAGGLGRSPMVGRGLELERFRRQVERLTRGEGGIISLVGDAGIGKSRLVREALWSPQLDDVHLLVGRSSASAQTVGFHPFADLLWSWAGIAGGEDAAAATAELAAAVARVCGDEADEMVPYLASMMRLGDTGEVAEHLRERDGEALERLTVRSVRRLLWHLADERPLLIFLEDLHWADQSSLRLLENLLSLVTETRVLFVHAFRPRYLDTAQRLLDVARTQYPLQHRLFALEPLSESESARLAANLLGDRAGADAIAPRIAAHAAGNPLFVEESLRALLDGGAIEVTAQSGAAEPMSEAIAVPASLAEVIDSRLQHLDTAARALLEVAAVIGASSLGRILESVLRDLLTRDIDIEPIVESLKERGILAERRTRRTSVHARRAFAREVEFSFVHALLQETIYDGIAPERRRELHRRVALATEAVFAGRIRDFHAMLAYHFLRADEPERAEEYLFKAGEEAARSAASTEALAFFREAALIYQQIHGAGGDPAKLAVLERNIGIALMNTGKLAEALPHLDRSLGHLGDPPPRSPVVAALRFAGDLAAVLGRRYLPAALSRRPTGDRYRDHILALYPRVKAQSTSDPTRLVYDYTRAVRLLDQTDPAAVPEQVIGLYGGFAAMFAYSGISFRIGRRFLAHADTLRRPGHAKDRFDHDCLVCICNYLEGVWDDDSGSVAADVVERALRYGGLWEVNTYLGLDADRRLRRGDFAGARARLDQLTEMADSYGFAFARTNSLGESVLLLLEQRLVEAARDAASLYLAQAADSPLRVLALGARAKAEVLLGDLAGAESSLADAEEVIAAAPVLPPWHGSAWAAARLLYDLEIGDLARAQRSARAARRMSARCAVQRGEILRLHARLHVLRGDHRRAAAAAVRALTECERLGALPELARLHADLAAWDLGIVAGRDAAAHAERAAELFAVIGLTATAAQRRAA